MGIAAEKLAPISIVLFAAGILIWGYYRARPYGKIGLLSWLQSVSVTAPWLLFFALFSAGIFINFAGVLFLIVASVLAYIGLGRQLRAAARDPEQRAYLEKLANAQRSSKSDESSQTSDLAEPSEDSEAAEPSPDTARPTEPVAASVRDRDRESDRPFQNLSVPEDDLHCIQEIFGIDTFFATETIPYQSGAIFKGNLRGEVEATHQELSKKLHDRVGDRYRLFFVNDPDEKTVVVVLPSRNDPQPLTTNQQILAVVLFVATIVTTLETGGAFLGFDLFENLNRWTETLPLALGIWAILLVHELGHRIAAGRYGIALSPPFFLPTWQIGSFGAITRFESLLPNRSTLFDIAIAGPAAGGLLSLGMLAVGFVLSHDGSLFQLPSEFFRGSVLVGLLAKAFLGEALQQSLVDVHPLVVLGWLGLVINALNLIPAGQLDGGRVMQAIYGRRIAGRSTIATLIVLAIASFVNPLALYWAIVILVIQRDLERPNLNEITEPDDTRAILAFVALLVMLMTLIPFTPSLALRLGL
ncbi:site-2 protease family protein [Geitlerinema sp. CS-897]|nr:site-2 protease family protein [Geitlerinema sp. CS-897]